MHMNGRGKGKNQKREPGREEKEREKYVSNTYTKLHRIPIWKHIFRANLQKTKQKEKRARTRKTI